MLLSLALAIATCSLPSDVNAQSLHASTSLVFVGNAFSIETASAGLDAVIQSDSLVNEEPWMWVGLRARAYTDSGGVNVQFRSERRLVGNTTKDSLRALNILMTSGTVLPADSLPLNIEVDHLEYSALDLVTIPVEQGPWSLQLRGSLLFAAEHNQVKGAGLGYRNVADNTFRVHMDLKEIRASGGSGWSLGGRLTYAAPALRVTLDASDAMGQIEWSNARKRNGLLNTNNQMFKKDGPPSFAPFIQGKHAVTDESARPMPNWSLRVEPKGPIAFQAEVIDATLVTGTVEASLNPNLRFKLGRIAFPASATIVGLDWKGWHLALITDSINPVSARVFSVQAGGAIVF